MKRAHLKIATARMSAVPAIHGHKKFVASPTSQYPLLCQQISLSSLTSTMFAAGVVTSVGRSNARVCRLEGQRQRPRAARRRKPSWKRFLHPTLPMLKIAKSKCQTCKRRAVMMLTPRTKRHLMCNASNRTGAEVSTKGVVSIIMFQVCGRVLGGCRMLVSGAAEDKKGMASLCSGSQASFARACSLGQVLDFPGRILCIYYNGEREG
jgi:hypothetical protein